MDRKWINFWREVFELCLGIVVIFVAPFFLSGGTIWQILAVAILIGALSAPFIGSWFIRWIVRRINRRDDPRYAKVPPDIP